MTPAVPRISVLIPTHNRAEVVGFAIRSVLAQTEPDFELLVVGDGCTDATADVVTSFDDPRIKWFDLPKAEGFGHANRNIALRQAKTELVAFAAHDDLLFPDHLERLCAYFADPSVDWAYSRPLWVDYDGLMVPSTTDLRDVDQRTRFLTGYNTIPASNVVYRRRVHDEIGLWPESGRSGGDWDLWKRIVRRLGVRIGYEAEPTAAHVRANWRTGSAWNPMPDWFEFARRGSWPGSLRIRVGDGQLAQEAIWEEMSGHPAEWAASVRSGVFEALDLLEQHDRMRRKPERNATRTLGAGTRRLQLALRGNPLFDPDWYAANNPDVRAGAARQHWKTVGVHELRDPNPHFSTRAYLERYPDVRASGMDPLDHYFVFGLLEGRNAKPWD